MNKKSRLPLATICCVLALSGCGNSGSAKSTPAQTDAIGTPKLSSDPVTITMYASNNMFSDDEVKQYVADPVHKKYPQITVVRTTAKLDDLLASGDIPDIIGSYPGPLSDTLTKYKFLNNLEPLMKKFNFDANRFSKEALDTLRVAGGQDYLVGLPAYTNGFALFYNKDVFDKFGVAYPKDGMYWDDVAALGKKLTRMDGGTQYRGIFPDAIGRIQQQRSIPFADFTTNKSLLNGDQWKQAFQDWGTLFMIPGLTEGAYKVPNAGKNQDAFVQGTLALIASHSNFMQQLRKTPQVNWDMVTYPQWKSTPGVGQRLDSPIFAIAAQSKHQDAAFAVLDTLLSDDVQMDLQHNGRMTVLKDEKFKPEFGSALTDLKGKNLVAMTKLKFAVMPPFKYIPDSDSNKIINDAFNAYIASEKDLNTALREADEQMNKLIQDKMPK